MKKNYFAYLIYSIIVLNSLNSNLAQAVLSTVGLEGYKSHGQKLKQLAENILSKDGYDVTWIPIGAGYNGAVFKATNKQGEKFAIKLSYSDPSSIRMSQPGAWKPRTLVSYDYSYLGELELSRRFVDLNTYKSAIYDESTHVKKYQPVSLGAGIPKIHALYRFLDLDYVGSYYWSIITVMDWVDGDDLKTYSENNQFDDSDVLDWTLKILDALKPLHDAGWYHRDISGSNVMRRPDGSICVVDLGKAIDYYDNNKDTVAPWHNPDLIANRDRDPDIGEISGLVRRQLYNSKNYVCNNKDFHDKIVSAIDESDNCKVLYEKLSKLK